MFIFEYAGNMICSANACFHFGLVKSKLSCFFSKSVVNRHNGDVIYATTNVVDEVLEIVFGVYTNELQTHVVPFVDALH